ELVETTTTVNGEPITVAVPPRLHVADFLRQQLGLTGTHVGWRLEERAHWNALTQFGGGMGM
ncbi:MAG: Carbon-monoxide dehydrogenase small subunit, partial [Blastococcus sp.]|nr:Carbon-monoxide dehydrogenase small subunit [Blastococcus sp.]